MRRPGLGLGFGIVVEVFVHEDWFNGDSVTVIIVDPASDRDARTVWCTVVEPVVSPDDFRVAVASDHVWWNPPTDCADAKDVPAGVVQVEFQDLPGGPYSSP